MISAGDYPFLAISDLTCCLEDTRLGVFCFLCHLIVRRPNLKVAIKRLLHQKAKILG